MSSHASTEQCHYDKDYISISCYVITSVEIVLYILLRVAVIMKEGED